MEPLDIAFMVVMLGHIFICPYTKVEESFNLQAMHDIIYHGQEVSKYDHLEFPGVVPRSFLGPLFVTSIFTPVSTILQASLPKLYMQYLVRSLLGALVTFSFFHLKQMVKRSIGNSVANWFVLITMTQFHFLFYASRPLPNIFALAIVLHSIRWWWVGDHPQFIWSSALVILVFRAELCIYLGLLLLLELLSRRLCITKLLLHGFLSSIAWIGLTILVDSYFWGRWLWPEAEVFWFNTILNKSSQWGTLPYFWYFYSALPRALSSSLVLVPLGFLVDHRRAVPLLLPAICFILIYSFLPHKELRFIIYVIPVFNVVAAMGAAKLWRNRNDSWMKKIVAIGVGSHLLVNAITTMLFTTVSHLNYPGGNAISALHELEVPDGDVHVHIDVGTAQTGVSRFTQFHENWIYNKTENLEPGGKDMLQYSHLLMTPDNQHELDIYGNSHILLKSVEGFLKIKLNPAVFPPLELQTVPRTFILKNIIKKKKKKIE